MKIWIIAIPIIIIALVATKNKILKVKETPPSPKQPSSSRWKLPDDEN